MKGNSIAQASVRITTDADKLHSGLRGVGTDVDKWGKTAGGKAGGSFGSSFSGGLKFGVAAVAIGVVAKGVSELVQGFGELTDAIDKTSKLATTLGMPTESLVGWQHAADLSGVSSEELNVALLRFRKQTEGPMDEALTNFLRSLEGITDEGQRSAAMTAAFGKAGQRLAPMFADGAAGIEKMKAEAKALGITFTAEEGKQVEAANDAITRVKTGFRGLWQGVVVGLAPTLESVMGFVQGAVKFARPFIDWFSRGFNQLWDIGKIVFKGLKELIGGLFGSIGIADDSPFGKWLIDLPTIEVVAVKVFRTVGTVGAYMWDVLKAGAGALAIGVASIIKGFSMLVGAFKKIVELLKELPEELRPAGMDKFIAGVGAFEEDVGGLAKGVFDWGMGAVKGIGDSAKEWNKWLDGALTKKKELEKPGNRNQLGGEFGFPSLVSDPAKLAAAFTRGSREAYSMAVRNRFGITDDKDKKQVDELKKIKKNGEIGNKKLGDIKDIFDDLGAG